MAVLLPTGIQYLDTTGAILANGTLNFYVASSTTPKNVYSDQSGGVALGTSVTLDSAGRIPSAGVWLDGSYKIIIKNSAGTAQWTIDTVNGYNPVDWSTLTATVAQINSVATALGTPGTVTASKAVVVDSNKDISTFRNHTAVTSIATTALQAPQINDANGVAAVTIASTASQVNGIKLTPAVTTAFPLISAYGSDTNVDLKLSGQGTGKVQLSGITYPTVDGSANQVMITNGARVLSFASTNVGVVKQAQTYTTSDVATGSTVLPADDTIPQNSEGDQYMSLSITPNATTNKLIINATIFCASSVANTITAALFQDSTANALAAVSAYNGTSNGTVTLSLNWTLVTGTTSATTFKIRVGGASVGTTTFNGVSGARRYGGVAASSITITEVSP